MVRRSVPCDQTLFDSLLGRRSSGLSLGWELLLRLLTDPSRQFCPSSNARAQDSRLCLELKGPRRSNTSYNAEPRGHFCQFLKCDRRLTSEPAYSLPIPRLCSSV
ncbi:hypothetical protein VNO77_08265 [Canavalia gladiata]|uniref:Uncharacterized protein n=1 Tax=Canavalia gladiata TaxID=3824 RepID=A0AAN9M8C7_CANGL